MCMLSDWIFCRYLLGPFGLECTLFPTFPSWFPIYIIYHCWKYNTEVPTSGKEPACNAGDTRDEGSIPGSGSSPGGGHGNSLQYSCLQNPMDGAVWWSTVHGVAKSTTRRSMHEQKLPQGEFSLDFENNRTQVIQYLNRKVYSLIHIFLLKITTFPKRNRHSCWGWREANTRNKGREWGSSIDFK